MDDFARALIGFFAIVDPLGNILAFQAVAGRAKQRDKVAIALLAVSVSFALIVVFALAGGEVLNFLGISPASFQIAAGILLVLPALRLVERGEVFDASFDGRPPTIDAAVVPLALPMLSGPGALAFATSSAQRYGDGVTVVAAGIVLLAAFTLFVLTARLMRVIHPAALRALARIIGVILMAIAVDFVVAGWLEATAS